MQQPELTDALVELIRRAATQLPADVVEAIERGKAREAPGSAAASALDTVLTNIEMARTKSTPMCQDTGTPLFWIHYPLGVSMRVLKAQVRAACATATKRSYLRPNAVDSLTGENSGNNTGIDYPTMHFEEWEAGHIHVDLILKGGGCENVSTQYKLPANALGAGRDLEGVRRVVLDAVHKAQGLGCAPGVLGIAIGGDRGASYVKAKEALLRPMGARHAEPALAALEERLYHDANELGIGPMGFGGKTTVLDVKVETLHRLPASYFVSVAYMCWANRHASMDVTLDTGEVNYG